MIKQMKTTANITAEDKKIGIIIRRLRNERNMTQTELADMMNTTRTCVANWENGSRVPGCNSVKKLASVFGVPMDYIYGKTNHQYNINIPDYFEMDLMKLNDAGKNMIFDYYKYLTSNEKYAAK